MGHNRAGVRAKAKLRRRLREERRLADKVVKPQATPTGAAKAGGTK